MSFVQQASLRGQFVESMLMHSSSFRCDQIYNCQIYNFGHTLLCYLSLQQTHLSFVLSNKSVEEVQFLSRSAVRQRGKQLI